MTTTEDQQGPTTEDQQGPIYNKIDDGIEVEITVRSRKNGKPVGNAARLYAVSVGEKCGEADRNRIAEEVGQRADSYLRSRLVGPT